MSLTEMRLTRAKQTISIRVIWDKIRKSTIVEAEWDSVAGHDLCARIAKTFGVTF